MAFVNGFKNSSKYVPSRLIMFLHKNRKYIINNRRNYAKQAPDKAACNQPKTKKTFWQKFFTCDDRGDEEQKEDVPIACCRRRFCEDKQLDPDLSRFGGQPFKTCGTAFLIQRDLLPVKSDELSPEDKAVKKIETHPDLKEMLEDPLPKFESVSQRLIDVADRKMHPLYNKLRQTPRRTSVRRDCIPPSYKSIAGNIRVDDIPLNIKFNKKLLEQKNLYAEYKRVDPPKQLIGKLIEMKKNERPTLQFAKNIDTSLAPSQNKTIRKRFVFDTLNQKDSCT